jgi:Zn-dependent peptidase ImmA (M78 family)
MNTTLKGDAFEDVIYHLLEREIGEDRFWARKECCKLFRKKGYYSKDRKTDIIFDISIEVTLPGEDEYSLLILVECKDYSTRVPVNDVEEFWAKITQVTGANAKGVLASRGAFQDGALRFAESKGFAILRQACNGELKWVLKRSASWSGSHIRGDAREIRQALTADVVVGAYHDWSFFVKGSYTYSAAAMFDRLCLQGNQPPRAELLASVRNSQRQIHRAVPFVEQEHIESVANACLEKIGYFDGPVDLFEICRWQRDECGLSVKYEPSRPGNPVLGTMSGAPIEICLYSNSPESGRSRFTLAHELGHLLMRHNLYMSSERTYESDLQSDSYAVIEFGDLRRMEWQANAFASCLLLPIDSFVRRFYAIAQARDLYDRGFGMLYVDHQPVNMSNFLAVTSYLSEAFNVSREATIIRLKQLGYLNDARARTGFQRLGAVLDTVAEGSRSH